MVWDFAASNGFTLVSKDSDFHSRSLLFGHPPKLLWMRMGNCNRNELLRLLADHAAGIQTFHLDPAAAILVIS